MTPLHFAITGTTTGIGAALAARLLADGHRVTGFDIVVPSNCAFECHALDLGSAQSIIDATAIASGPFDGLCNNAGIPPRDGAAEPILRVNFLGQRAFTRAMMQKFKPGASIVNMASRAGAGWQQGLEQAKRLASLTLASDVGAFVRAEDIDHVRAYNLSKEAMILWTMAEAEPMIARKLRINSVSPGAITTGIYDDFVRAFGDKMAKNVARAGRAGEPDEIAAVVAFLLFPDSNWIKGCDIVPDGGMSAFAASDRFALNNFHN